ncbi:MAG: orotidine-5'-phosphate decarboxylase [Acidobacteriota bacterium]|nr:MAG: orotidine-5'-phosphate decarboxylase [Acidobacteriota bacterium]
MDNTDLHEKQKRRLIVALDVSTADEALEAVSELRGEVGAFKVGLQLFTSEGASLVKRLAASGIEIFLDVKYHDIPNTVAGAAAEAAKMGIWMFNVHASGGSEMMKAALGAANDACERESLRLPKIVGVTVLTSSDRQALSETGIEQTVEERVLQLSELTAKCGLHGVVVSPFEARMIRDSLRVPGFEIVTPGIRPSNATHDDQKRVMTPAQAASAGSDYLVVGRPIMGAGDRVEAARQIVKEMTEAAGPTDPR